MTGLQLSEPRRAALAKFLDRLIKADPSERKSLAEALRDSDWAGFVGNTQAVVPYLRARAAAALQEVRAWWQPARCTAARFGADACMQ